MNITSLKGTKAALLQVAKEVGEMPGQDVQLNQAPGVVAEIQDIETAVGLQIKKYADFGKGDNFQRSPAENLGIVLSNLQDDLQTNGTSSTPAELAAGFKDLARFVEYAKLGVDQFDLPGK